MSVILMTTLFYKALILQGEIWCWSLLGLKGLSFNDLQGGKEKWGKNIWKYFIFQRTLNGKWFAKTQTNIRGSDDDHCDSFPFALRISPIYAFLANT